MIVFPTSIRSTFCSHVLYMNCRQATTYTTDDARNVHIHSLKVRNAIKNIFFYLNELFRGIFFRHGFFCCCLKKFFVSQTLNPFYLTFPLELQGATHEIFTCKVFLFLFRLEFDEICVHANKSLLFIVSKARSLSNLKTQQLLIVLSENK